MVLGVKRLRINSKKYAVVAMALIFSTSASLAAQCVAKDANGNAFLSLDNGQIIKFVKEGEALLRDVNAQGMPQHLGKIESVELAPGCKVLLRGNGGAKWGHMNVKQSGPTGVPANHVYAFGCECS